MKSSNSYLRYVDLSFVPNREDYLIGKYFVEKAGGSNLEGLAFLGSIAAESSTGTWTEVRADGLVTKNVSGIVYMYSAETNLAEIAYPVELFERGNLSQLLTVFAGNAFGLADIQKLKLLDIYFPPKYIKGFLGPKFGLDGIYNKLERNRREPLLGSIIKPKCGLSNEQFAELTYDSMLGMYEEHQVDGVDFVKDDEALSSQDAFGSDFYNRVTLTLEKVKRVEDITGRKKDLHSKYHALNIFESVRRAEFVVRSGGSAAMIDYVISGGANLDSIRRQNLDLIIHGHRTLFAAMHRPSDFGIHYRVWAKIFRMVGGDQVHSGTPELGVMSSNSADVIEVCSIVANDSQISTDRFNIDWGVTNTKSCLPICGAGLDLTAVAPLTKKLGANVAIFAGGGVHGHPEGTRAGASSMRSAANAVLEKMDLQNFVSTRKLPFLDLAYSHFLEFDKQSPNKVPRGMM